MLLYVRILAFRLLVHHLPMQPHLTWKLGKALKVRLLGQKVKRIAITSIVETTTRPTGMTRPGRIPKPHPAQAQRGLIHNRDRPQAPHLHPLLLDETMAISRSPQLTFVPNHLLPPFPMVRNWIHSRRQEGLQVHPMTGLHAWKFGIFKIFIPTET